MQIEGGSAAFIHVIHIKGATRVTNADN